MDAVNKTLVDCETSNWTDKQCNTGECDSFEIERWMANNVRAEINMQAAFALQYD